MTLRFRSSAVVIASLIALSAYASTYTFGTSGRSGSDGATGDHGRSGQDVVITATGQSLALDLSGSDGRDGRDGYDGDHATGCTQPTGAYSVTGADGGNGGDGGRGGTGGSGGDLMVYAADIGNLARVSVRSIPGRGGEGGRYGRGGEGCDCTDSSWEAESCETDPVTKEETCSTGTYSCTSGDNGYSGRQGERGSDGSLGQLSLVKRLQPLESVEPSRSMHLMQLFDGVLTLSDNIWIPRAGALSLLAPGSQLLDSYREFSHKQLYKSAYAWEARKSVADFAGLPVSVSVSIPNGRSYLNLPSSVWHQTRDSLNGDVHVTTIEKILYAEDAAKLTVAWEGSGPTLALVLKDTAEVSDLVSTQVQVRFMKQKSLRKDKKLFEGTVPADLVVRDGHTFRVLLGKLPGIEADDIKSGKTVDADVSIKRSLNRFETTVYAKKVEYKIPKK